MAMFWGQTQKSKNAGQKKKAELLIPAEVGSPMQNGMWQTWENLQKWCGDNRKRCDKKRNPEFKFL